MEYLNNNITERKNKNKNKKQVNENIKKLGQCIYEKPIKINNREEFGHWEIDTVIGEKNKNDNVLLTIVERKTRYYIILKINDKKSSSVMDNIYKIYILFKSYIHSLNIFGYLNYNAFNLLLQFR